MQEVGSECLDDLDMCWIEHGYDTYSDNTETGSVFSDGGSKQAPTKPLPRVRGIIPVLEQKIPKLG